MNLRQKLTLLTNMDDTVIMVNIYAGGQVRVFFCSLTKRAWVFYVVLILRRN